jgi:hypothetical protein
MACGFTGNTFFEMGRASNILGKKIFKGYKLNFAIRHVLYVMISNTPEQEFASNAMPDYAKIIFTSLVLNFLYFNLNLIRHFLKHLYLS